jgi:hypothetical protein
MAQTNYTPISLYYSTTASAVPTAANLVPGELAINTNDGKLYYEDSSGVVQVLATKSTGSIGGSTTQVQYNSSGSLAGSANLTFDGTNLTTGGTNTATRFIPSGSTVATNGMFLPTTNILGFSTNSTERMRVDASGRLLIGVTSATDQGTRLGITNTADTSVVATFSNQHNVSGDGAGAFYLGANCNDTSSVYVNGSLFGVGVTFKIFGNGNMVNSNNSYGSLSDIKLKENIVDATPKLANLMQVKVRNYNLINSTTKQIGVIAQELETVFPSMIDESRDKDDEGNDLGTTTKSVKYSVFVPMLIKAIQELKTEFDAYKASHP